MDGDMAYGIRQPAIHSGNVSTDFAQLLSKYGASPQLLRRVAEVTEDELTTESPATVDRAAPASQEWSRRLKWQRLFADNRSVLLPDRWRWRMPPTAVANLLGVMIGALVLAAQVMLATVLSPVPFSATVCGSSIVTGVAGYHLFLWATSRQQSDELAKSFAAEGGDDASSTLLIPVYADGNLAVLREDDLRAVQVRVDSAISDVVAAIDTGDQGLRQINGLTDEAERIKYMLGALRDAIEVAGAAGRRQRLDRLTYWSEALAYQLVRNSKAIEFATGALAAGDGEAARRLADLLVEHHSSRASDPVERPPGRPDRDEHAERQVSKNRQLE